MPGRSTLTATSRPSCSVAKCTCAIEALATGSASKLANTASIGRPNARSIELASPARPGTAARGPAASRSSSAMSGGSRSRRVDSTWPNLTKIGPSVSSARRSRYAARRVEPAADRDDPRQRAHPALRESSTARSSSSPKRRTVKTMKTSRARCLIGALLRPQRRAAGSRARAMPCRDALAWRAAPARRRDRRCRVAVRRRGPTRRSRSSSTSQRRLSISQSTSAAKRRVACDRRPPAYVRPAHAPAAVATGSTRRHAQRAGRLAAAASAAQPFEQAGRRDTRTCTAAAPAAAPASPRLQTDSTPCRHAAARRRIAAGSAQARG